MARLYQKINNEAVPLGGGGGGSVAIDNDTITENSDGEIQVAPALTGKINQLNNVAADMGKVLTANGNGTAEWDDILVPIDYETITKNGNGELQVSSVPYDNTESGLTADNVQDAIDEVNSNLTASDGLDFRFATDGEGNYGYLGADDSFVPFKSGGSSDCFCAHYDSLTSNFFECGFRPTKMYISGKFDNKIGAVISCDVSLYPTLQFIKYMNTSAYERTFGISSEIGFETISDNGFSIRHEFTSRWSDVTVMACK